MENKWISERLTQIQIEMNKLLDESIKLVRRSGDRLEYERALAYWHPQIQMALNNEHNYVGSSGHTLEQTIASLSTDEEDEEEEDDGA